MCALPRATTVTTEYQRDSSSKRPRASVVSAARPPTRCRTTRPTRRPGLRALRAAPTVPLDTASATWWEAPMRVSWRFLALVKPPSNKSGL